MLLGWDTLYSQNNIAAILYPTPVRVSSIRVFPTGAQPFSQSPESVAITEPEAFFLDVFFNSQSIQPTNAQDLQEKRVVKNALAPTRMAFAGGPTEFAVDMGPEYATRLIIFRGDFKVISVAIYGDKVTELPEAQTYELSSLPVISPIPLSSSVDLGNSANPTLLADRLLTLFPSPPSLSLISRLVFSLKPENEDWDDPDFPYIYSNLDDDEVTDLESLVQSIARPIRDDISPESLSRFATGMQDFLGSNPSDDAYFVAKLLTKAASQQTRISRTLLQHLDLPDVFNEHSLDDTTVLCLRDAAANIDIARHFSEDEPFFKSLEEMHNNPKTEKSIQKALKKLLARMRGWQTFEDALTNVNGDFTTSAAFLEDITTGEHSLGCWLECMLNHDSLVLKLGTTLPSGSRQHPPLLFQVRPQQVSHDQFVVFVRALLGVSTVLATLAWSDSIGNGACRDRALSILVLWQNVDGYREIVNHCLLLRQLTKRLGWNKTDDIPTKSAVLAERLLVALAKDPQAMLRDHVIETVLSLEPPFSFIESEEMLAIAKLAMVARDELSSAVEELTYTSVRPFSLRRLRVLRVSMAIIKEEMTYDDGEMHVLENFWDEQNERSQGIGPTLIPILVDISDDLNHHFALQPIFRMNQALSDLLFRTADDLLHLIAQFVLVYPPPSRDLRNLSNAIAHLYACSHIASTRFSSSSAAYLAAQRIRQTCPQILVNIIDFSVRAEETSTAEAVLRTLLNCAHQNAGRDPAHHLLQLHDLLDNIFPLPQTSISNGQTEAVTSVWVTDVLPKVLSELKAFCRLLDSETRARFLDRLNVLDNGETGIGEWLLTEELKSLLNVLHDLSGSWQDDDHRLILQYQSATSIQFFNSLILSPSASTWTMASLLTSADLSQLLDDCLSVIIEANLSSLYLTHFVRQLGKHAGDFGPDVRLHILILVLRNAAMDPSVLDALSLVPGILQSLPTTTIASEHLQLQREVGRMVSSYSDHAPTLQPENADVLLQILEWLVSQEDPKLTRLAGISLESFQYLCTMLSATLAEARQEALKAVEEKLNVDEDELLASATTELPETLTLPLKSIENLLSPKPFEPSTPKKGTNTPDILGVVISPPTALLRSPAATGLTKTYANNDFRQLRQVPSTRLNTSRMPSTHVDDFEPPSPERLLAAAQIESPIHGFQGLLPGF